MCIHYSPTIFSVPLFLKERSTGRDFQSYESILGLLSLYAKFGCLLYLNVSSGSPSFLKTELTFYCVAVPCNVQDL